MLKKLIKKHPSDVANETSKRSTDEVEQDPTASDRRSEEGLVAKCRAVTVIATTPSPNNCYKCRWL